MADSNPRSTTTDICDTAVSSSTNTGMTATVIRRAGDGNISSNVCGSIGTNNIITSNADRNNDAPTLSAPNGIASSRKRRNDDCDNNGNGSLKKSKDNNNNVRIVTTDDQRRQQQQPKQIQTPHTMRLLKLIRNSTNREYATIAIERLIASVSSSMQRITGNTTTRPPNDNTTIDNNNSDNHSVQIQPIQQVWDLLGRLQSFLTVSEWYTRQISSVAIYEIIVLLLHYQQQQQKQKQSVPVQGQDEEQQERVFSLLLPNLFSMGDTSIHNVDEANSASAFHYLTITQLLPLSSSSSNDKNIIDDDDDDNDDHNIHDTNSSNESNSNHSPKEDENGNATGTSTHLYSMDHILQYGHKLYATSNDKYTIGSNSTTTASSTATRSNYNSQNKNITNDNTDDDYDVNNFVQYRIQQQRQLLASRLGLVGGVLFTSSDNNEEQQQQQQFQLLKSYNNGDNENDMLITKDDLLQEVDEVPAPATSADLGVTYNQQEYETHVQDALENTTSTSTTATNTTRHPNTIREMLLRTIFTTNANSSNNKNSPQELFVTELLVRIFDPLWYVRHGALLGILALLRAYIKSYNSTNANTSRPLSDLFGTWTHDLLVRCLCVIALDRFGDFAGSCTADQHNHSIDDDYTLLLLSSTSSTTNIRQASHRTTSTTSVVAPVREVCGQIIAILHGVAPLNIAKQTRIVLIHLANYQLAWEVRHGALIALKYIIVVELSNLLHQKSTSSTVNASGKNNETEHPDSVPDYHRGHEQYRKWIQRMGRIAIQHLSDTSDDVKSTSAHILIEICRGTAAAEHYIETETNRAQSLSYSFIWDAVLPLWRVLQTTRDFSSCIVDLVELCTILITRNCRSFLNRLQSDTTPTIVDPKPSSVGGEPQKPISISYVIAYLMRLLDSDFQSVRLSAIQCIRTVCIECASTATLYSNNDSQSTDLMATAETLHDLTLYIIRLFDSNDHSNECKEEIPRNILMFAWSSLCDLISKVSKFCDLSRFDMSLLSWYFQIGEERTMELNDIPNRLHAADALVCFLSKTMSSQQRISSIARCLMLAFIGSPWPSQVESTFLLYEKLSKVGIDRSSLVQFEEKMNPEMMFTCLSPDASRSTIDSPEISMLCDQICLSIMNDVNIGTKAPATGANEITSRWLELCIVTKRQDTKLETKIVSPFTEMRLMATFAGSIILKGLPSKLSPLVRMLMTFFNSEIASISRIQSVAKYFVLLLKQIIPVPKFSNAYTKILSSLLDAIAYRSCGGIFYELRNSLASAVLRPIVNEFGSGPTFHALDPVWQRLEPISCQDDLAEYKDDVILDAMDVLEMLVTGLQSNPVLATQLIKQHSPGLIELSLLFKAITIQDRALATLNSLCRISTHYFLSSVIPKIVWEFTESNCAARRFNACVVMDSVVKCSGTDICPFVRGLLPPILSLMSDTSIQCSQRATAIFASLVKVAPLVQQVHSPCQELEDKHIGSVFDHLIFGKPLPPCQIPAEIIAAMQEKSVNLRNYQKEGISWLQFLQSVNLNGALCDDMGIGKSLQALVAIAMAHDKYNRIANLKRSKLVLRSLIVCPSTLVGHWAGEIEKYFPPKSVFKYLCLAGNKAERLHRWRQKSDNINVVITSYSSLRNDIDILESEDWCYCVLDEGHLLKNPKTATARSSKRLRSKHKLVLTGTLIQNRIHELWATFDFLMPSFLGSSKAFMINFANPITRSQLPNASASNIAEGLSKLRMLHQQVLPFILRREKSQVLPELPRMTQTTIKVEMSTLQRHMYNDFCFNRKADVSLETLESTFLNSTTDSGKNAGSDVLKSLLFLRLVCTHPSLVLNEQQRHSCPASFFTASVSGKMLALAELLRGVLNYDDEMNAADNDESFLYCENDTDDQDAYSSMISIPDPCIGDKLSISNPVEGTSKCLVFAQFTKSLDAVEEILLRTQMPKLRYCRLDGSVPPEKRIEVVNNFQNDPHMRVLLLTTRVGGIGLSLTSANTVIFLEIDYNPYADFQAQDRCMRIGQTKQVNVYRIITDNSIEEKIIALQTKKIQLTEAVVNNENSTMYSMGTDRLLDLFDVDDNTDKAKEHILTLDYDLEGITEQCANDYTNLALDQFISNFQS